ncbi:Aminotransferase-like [Abeliophyllum distichum]|uniref:Aminotransferase-like n=1 Tax=Abeliophyllum distichum TaxID=126358 RepID=A0ABD1PUU7_9LAMI
MVTSKNPSDNRINFEDFQELLTRPYVNPSCLLPSKPELNEFYLGPSFNDADSVGTTKEIFYRAKISDLLEIATRLPLYDPILFPIALSFWSCEYNTFIFPFGPISITLRDVGALVNLPPLGDTVSPAILIYSAAPKFEKKYTDFYSGMQELYNNSGGEPTHAESVAFLQRYGLSLVSTEN